MGTHVQPCLAASNVVHGFFSAQARLCRA